MKTWMIALVTLASLCAVAGAAEAQTMTIDQKIKLSVSAKNEQGAPVVLPAGTVITWATEGGAAMGTFVQTGIASGELATYYAPAKPGIHNVTASLTVENMPFTAKIQVAVTSVIPAVIVITAGTPIPK